MTWSEVVTKVRDTIERSLGVEAAKSFGVESQRSAPADIAGGLVATPAVDIYENEREFLIHADVPGGTRGGVTVTWDEHNGLTFRVKNEAQPRPEAGTSDYEPCDWYRRLELPAYLDGSKGTSTLAHGVLTVRIPKRKVTSRTIPIRQN